MGQSTQTTSGIDTSVSIVIPAWNEEALIGRTLEHLGQVTAQLPLKEIIVVDNNSTDRTAEIARRHGARVVFEPYNQISRARNCGGNEACGSFLFFIDADTWPSAEILHAGYRALAEGAVGVGSLVQFEGEVSAFWGWVLGVWNWLSRTFSLAAGSFLLCRADAFPEVGGFPTDVYAGEEVIFSRKLRSWSRINTGGAFHILRGLPITTSARKFKGRTAVLSLVQTLLLTLCPVSVRWRWACWIWYRR